jgi:hypothetical protein
MAVRIKIKAGSLEEVNLQAATDYLAKKVEDAFREKIGPDYVNVAKKRAPVGEDWLPRSPKGKQFFPVGLRPKRDFRRASFEKQARRAELEAILAEAKGNARIDVLRGGEEEFFRFTGGPNKGATPDIIDVRRGGLVGAARHRAGTLRDSIKIISIERAGSTVTMKIAATAPYAWFVHEGFTHKGGWGPNKTGKTTRVKGQKFLETPLTNVRERLKNPRTYIG